MEARNGIADHGRRWWILAVLCLSVLLVVVDNTIVNVALPTISRDLHASTSALQWVVDGYTLSFAGLLLLGGNLGDRLGRRRFLQLGLVLFGVFSVGAALSRNTGELIAARALMGFAAALVDPATLAILHTVFTVARERAIAIGVWSAVSGLAVADPLQGRGRGVQVAADRRQRDVHDRVVHDHEQHAEAEHRQDPPPAVIACFHLVPSSKNVVL